MSRGWIGIALLVVLLILGLTASAVMDRMQLPITRQLEQAAQAALSGDTQQGFSAASTAQKQWEQRWRVTAALSDHGPMDEIDGLFGQLNAYMQSNQIQEFAACCRRIGVLVDAVREAHSLTWWNLL